MKKLTKAVLCIALISTLALPAFAQSTAFTYQGRLNDGANPANGIYDLRFTIYDALSGGSVAAGPLTIATTSVSDGLFTVTLDFGSSAFPGTDRWLEIGVRTNGGGAFTTLNPRQPMTPAPYALYTPSAGTAATATTASSVAPGSVTGAGIAAGAIGSPNIASGQVVKSLNALKDDVTLTPGANITITPSGNTLQLSASDATRWSLTGNAGTTPGVNFLGTTDNQPVELKANGQRALRLEPTASAPNIIGGYSGNQAASGVVGATVAGGGAPNLKNVVAANFASVLGGISNLASGVQAAVGGGGHNQASGRSAFIGGGGGLDAGGGGPYPNIASGDWSVINGGWLNSAAGHFSVIGGGVQNSIRTGSSYSTIGGGQGNAVSSNANHSSIAGGIGNMAGAGGTFIGGGSYNTNVGGGAFIGGGIANRTENFDGVVAGGAGNVNAGFRSFIGGGEGNFISNSAGHATIAGGIGNLAIAGGTFIGGGSYNTNDGGGAVIGGGFFNHAGNFDAFIGAGAFNGNLGFRSVIGGGEGNSIANTGSYATIGGGYGNLARGNSATVGGGGLNSAIGLNATVPGGAFSDALGDYSFASGRRAKGFHPGAFVWADSTDADFASTSNNQFSVRASGGVRLVTSGAGITLDGQPVLSGTVGSAQLANGSVTAAKIPVGQVVKSLNSLTDDVTLTAGTNITVTPIGNTLQIAATFLGPVSDNQLSSNIARLNAPATFNNPVQFASATGSFNGAFSGSAAGLTNLNIASSFGGGVAFELGTMAFFLSSSPVVGDAPYSVVAADVNGDAKADLISADFNSSTLTVLTNNGSGGFVLSSSPVVGDRPYSVIAADINGDGKVDLISANESDNTLTVLTNTGSGGFVLSSSPAVGNRPQSVVAADVNGDGRMDLISANATASTLTVLINNGSGGFVLSSSPAVGIAPYSVTAADVNGDRRVDLISANIGADTLSVLTNNGSGGFVLSSSPAVGDAPQSVAAADVNGDGKVDLISANQDGTLTVLTNNGSGGFVLSSSLAISDWPFSVTAADVNGDGKVDLISPNYGADTLTVLTNNGSGAFGLSSSPAVGGRPVAVAAADLNGDGKLDLISANYGGSGGNTLSVLFNSRQLNGVFVGNGTGLSGVNADVLDGFDGSDFARLAADQNFTGANSFSGATYFNGPIGFNDFNYFYGASTFAGASTFNGNVAVGSSTAISFGSQTRQMLNLWGAQYGIGVQSGTLYFRSANSVANNGFAWHRGGTHSDTLQDPGVGGGTLMTLDANRLTVNTAVGLGTANPAAKLHLYSTDNPTVFRIQSTGTPGFGRIEFVSNPQGDAFEWRPAYIESLDAGGFTGGLGFYLNGTGSGNTFGSVEVMRLINGRVGIGTVSPATALHVIGTVTATAFNPPSDRNLKENFAPVSPRDVLAKVAALPISHWNFKGDAATPHIGPMAQDFHAAFGLGTDDKHIATVDADGVALAAIQGLNQKLGEELQRRDAENAELRRELGQLKQLMQEFAHQLNGSAQ